jgi:leucyl-tRNA synthetase
MIYCNNCALEGKSWFDTQEEKQIPKKILNPKSEILDKSKIQNSNDKNNLEFSASNLEFAAGMAGWFPVPEKDLPVLLPDVEDWKPMGKGTSPLANHPEFYKTICPNCGKDAVRETDVSDTFLDSSWYFLRYPSSDIENEAFDIERTKKWLPVDMYIGGAEHSVLHLLYSRFVTMVLSDLNFIGFEEPFSTFFAHGLIIKDGAKMSKSKGNVVVPDAYIAKYGADTLRAYLMFLGPYSDGGDFRDSGIEGMYKFLRKVWKLLIEPGLATLESHSDSPERLKMMHKTIKDVTMDIKEFGYNTAIAKLMEWYNYLSSEVRSQKSGVSTQEAEVFLKLLAPFAPYMTEELWQNLGFRAQSQEAGSIHLESWPEYDEKYLVSDVITIVVQINGKKRGEIEVRSQDVEDRSLIEQMAKEAVEKQLEGQEMQKIIYVPGKIVNFVV